MISGLLSRRSAMFSLLAAPAVVRAGSLMPIKMLPRIILPPGVYIDAKVLSVTRLLTTEMITRETINLWYNSTLFYANLS